MDQRTAEGAVAVKTEFRRRNGPREVGGVEHPVFRIGAADGVVDSGNDPAFDAVGIGDDPEGIRRDRRDGRRVEHRIGDAGVVHRDFGGADEGVRVDEPLFKLVEDIYPHLFPTGHRILFGLPGVQDDAHVFLIVLDAAEIAFDRGDRVDVSLAAVGDVKEQFLVVRRGDFQAGGVETFDRVSPEESRLNVLGFGSAGEGAARVEDQQIQIMGEGVGDRTVQNRRAVDRQLARPVVAVIVGVVARPEAVGFQHPDFTEPPGEHALLDPAGFRLVHGLVADRDESAGAFRGFDHFFGVGDGRGDRLFHIDVSAGFQSGDGHRHVQRDAGRDEADVDLTGEIPQHVAVVGVEAAADGAKKFALLRLLFLIDHGGGDDVDAACGMFANEVMVVYVSESRNTDDGGIEHSVNLLTLRCRQF